MSMLLALLSSSASLSNINFWFNNQWNVTTKPVKVFNGTSWVAVTNQPKTYNGTTWI